MSRLEPEQLARIREIAERRLTPDELQAALAIPIGPDELARTQQLIRWFKRRYSTGAERLAYVRRAHRRWAAQTHRAG